MNNAVKRRYERDWSLSAAGRNHPAPCRATRHLEWIYNLSLLNAPNVPLPKDTMTLRTLHYTPDCQ